MSSDQHHDSNSQSARERRTMMEQGFAGTVENGRIKLDGNVVLPEHTKVYVLVPGIVSMPHLPSPRLVRPLRNQEEPKAP